MKPLAIILLWSLTLAASFLIGQKSVNEKVKVQTKVQEKIVYKKVLVENKQHLENVSNIKTKKKAEKKNNPEKHYHTKRFEFLTKRKNQEEALLDCENGNQHKCWLVRELYKITGQRAKLKQLLLSSCKNGKTDSCLRLYDSEVNPRKKKIIKTNLKKFCDDGNAQACVTLGNIFEHRNKKVDQDSFELKRKACELDVKSCHSFASVLYKQNDQRAEQLYVKSCEGGGEYSCISASNYYFEKGNNTKAGEMLRVGCDYGDSYQCRLHYEYLVANKKLSDAQAFKGRICRDGKGEGLFYCKK